MCLAIPGKLTSISAQLDETFRFGKVSFGGIMKEVNLSMVPQANVGDYVLVHVGVAISVVDEEEALKTFEYIKQIGELNELDDERNEASDRLKPASRSRFGIGRRSDA
jgi:hydrogenase expression/formation protein HypC